MTATTSEKLLQALLDPCVSAAEAVCELGADADLLAVRKPSRVAGGDSALEDELD